MPKFPLYSLYFSRYAPKTSKKIPKKLQYNDISKLGYQILYLIVNFMTKISVSKFPLYDLYFSRYAPKTNLKPNLGPKMWYKNFCIAGWGLFNVLFQAPKLTLFCKVPPLLQNVSFHISIAWTRFYKSFFECTFWIRDSNPNFKKYSESWFELFFSGSCPILVGRLIRGHDFWLPK